VDVGLNSIFPEGGREFGLNQESSGTSSNLFIGTLCNSILMWLVWFSVLATNPLISAEVIVLLANEFTSFVIPGHLDLLLKPFLSISLELLESHQCLRFAFEESNHLEPRCIINETLPIAITLCCWDRERAL
jgi:hypothetical protein